MLCSPSSSCNCMSLLLQECSKQGLLSEANMTNLTDKRYGPHGAWVAQQGWDTLSHCHSGREHEAAVVLLAGLQLGHPGLQG